jgi:uncharacterized protein (DUF1499 family)
MASFARTVSLIAGTLALLGLAAANTGLVAPLTGFQVCIGGALLGGLVGVVLSLIAIVTTRGGRDPVGRQKAWVGLAIGLGLLLAVLAGASTGGDAPPINDITTDLANPPAFASAEVVADYAGRDMSYPAEFVEIVRASYPDLAPLSTDTPPAETYALALAAAESLGWEISAKSDAENRFDAKDTTALFRFVDDVTVRVTADGTGSRVDVRSKSRDGRGDLGANAKRIRALFDAISSQTSG